MVDRRTQFLEGFGRVELVPEVERDPRQRRTASRHDFVDEAEQRAGEVPGTQPVDGVELALNQLLLYPHA